MSFLICVPFLGIILSIAFCPLFLPKIWHKHYGKIALGWLILGVFNIIYFFSIETAIHKITHTLFLEYIPFICLVLSLYTVSGGLRLYIQGNPSPLLNTGILLFGALLSNIVGTLGASIILIRPFLKLNHLRTHRVHHVIFFIFAVSNLGGVLTPLGDPPLFMGFLKGVDFFWTLNHLSKIYVLTLGLLLSIFYIIDRFLCEETYLTQDKKHKLKFMFEGKMHIFLLLGIIGLILQSGIWKPEEYHLVLGIELPIQNILRDAGLLAITVLSLLMTPMHIRKGHEFHWDPFLEVAKLFLAIFVTLIPVMDLAQNFGESIKNVLTPTLYFWLTGSLSAFLDNAPTYLVFFNLAGGNPGKLMFDQPEILKAISLGSVYMGALTYIGNAPNFMVASIAKNYQINMPSFFGYMVWSFSVLLPLFLIINWICL